MSECNWDKHKEMNDEICPDCNKYFHKTSIVRGNMMNDPHYRGYCGLNAKCIGSWPRTIFRQHLQQFECPACGWVSGYEPEFIQRWLERWKDDKSKPTIGHFF